MQFQDAETTWNFITSNDAKGFILTAGSAQSEEGIEHQNE